VADGADDMSANADELTANAGGSTTPADRVTAGAVETNEVLTK
jgi:hypothetical protein